MVPWEINHEEITLASPLSPEKEERKEKEKERKRMEDEKRIMRVGLSPASGEFKTRRSLERSCMS